MAPRKSFGACRSRARESAGARERRRAVKCGERRDDGRGEERRR